MISDFWSYRYKEALDGNLDIDEAVTFITNNETQVISDQVTDKLITWVEQVGGFDANSVLVDIGCGAGRFLKPFVMLSDGEVYGIEPDAHARLLCSRRFSCPVYKGSTFDFPPRGMPPPTHIFISGVFLYHTDQEILAFLHKIQEIPNVIIIIKEPVAFGVTYVEDTHRQPSLGRIHNAIYRKSEQLWRLFKDTKLIHVQEYGIDSWCWSARVYRSRSL